MGHPVDRSHIATEQRHPRSMGLHALSVGELVRLMNEEDRTVPEAVAAAAEVIARFIEAAEPGFVAGGRLVYLGAGTSGRLGVLDASEMPPTFLVPPDRVIGIIAGGDTALRKSSEGMEDDPHGAEAALRALDLTERDAVVGIAAGGTTPYVLGALEYVKGLASPPVTAMLTCSPIDRPAGADHLLLVDTGPEIITGSTRMKAGTATKLVINMISTTLMVRAGRVYENLMVDLTASNNKLRDRAARIITMLTDVARDEAFEILDAAQGNVKVAVVMHRRGMSREEATDALAAVAGRLERVLGA